MNRWVEIEFDCLPLRSVGRLDVPLDASPEFRARCQRVLAAIERHGSHNSYFLYNASCRFHITNDESLGTIAFRFEGTLLTDESDEKSLSCDLQTSLDWETCDWLTEPIVHWFTQSVDRSVLSEFNRYIAAGDLTRTKDRMNEVQASQEQSGGYLGMYL